MNEEEAFLVHNFAPPSLRRAIGILGFLHKRVLGLCHPALIQALPFQANRSGLYHDRTLESFLEDVVAYRDLYFRSLWHYVLVYDRLPRRVVHLDSVKEFQSLLTQVVRFRVQSGDPTWREAFQSCADVLSHLPH